MFVLETIEGIFKFYYDHQEAGTNTITFEPVLVVSGLVSLPSDVTLGSARPGDNTRRNPRMLSRHCDLYSPFTPTLALERQAEWSPEPFFGSVKCKCNTIISSLPLGQSMARESAILS